MFVIPEASLLWDLSWRSLVKILRIICRSGSCCKPSSGLGNKWRNQNGDKEEVTGKMLTKTYEVLGEVCIRQVPFSKASGSGKLTRFDRDHVEGYDAIGDDYERLPSAPSVF